MVNATGTHGTRTALVVGGGIAGPAMALALHKAGIRATVLEAYPTTAQGVGGAFMIAPNGLAALRLLGLDEQVRAIGQPIQRMLMDDPNGRRIAEFGGVPGLPPGLAMWRTDLYAVLERRLREVGITVEYGKRLVDVAERPDGVTAHFADGTSAEGDVLIGADGVRSTVRTLIDPAAPGPRNTGLIGLGGLSGHTLSGPAARTDTMHFANGRQAFFGWWALPGGGTAWFSNVKRAEELTAAQARETPAADWLARLREQHAGDHPAAEILRGVAPEQLVNVGSLHIMPRVPRWHRGRLVLIGDAAHAPSPSSGQGASLAVEGAVELARCLRDLPDPAVAFARYESLRRARVEKIIAQAERSNNEKTAGPAARLMLRLVAPVAVRTFLRPEKMFGPVHRYQVDWDRRLTA
ncbi:FAD-dependent monooxygenase [Kitasatospora sp. NBC_01287]|uniref:FAD-dependent oxidoreductase n=1 Tax=Kitasatospora sp. NBC_01287 TaxID=2903573 RepID=UPI00224EE625|nr:NAD(P)/FAD-dependent oxidoreductase [Kitasatospora sp. NBC_01287]MCX4746225.1 FAD-dependent monooxygenase [Kitasatospora sp. NBC_01287]